MPDASQRRAPLALLAAALTLQLLARADALPTATHAAVADAAPKNLTITFNESLTAASSPLPLTIASATMSSTKTNSASDCCDASNCIDGVMDNSCYSNNENEAWLRLDLGQQKSIASVKIWNRQSCCQERFGAHVVETSNDGTSFSTCGTYTLPSGPGPYTEPCDASARYVRLRMTKRSACSSDACALNLAEVQVMARTSQPTADTQNAFVSYILSPWHALQHDKTTACAVSITHLCGCRQRIPGGTGLETGNMGLRPRD